GPGRCAMAQPTLPGLARQRHVPRRQRGEFASTTVSAVMLTMRRTVALGVSTLMGALAPSSTGPTATLLPAAVLSRLYAILPASIVGHTSRLADPDRVEPGRMRFRATGSSATAAGISPSTSSHGASRRRILTASPCLTAAAAAVGARVEGGGSAA